MIALDFINSELFPLKPKDNCGFANETFVDHFMEVLPVVNKGKLQGIVFKNDLKKAKSTEKITPFIKGFTGKTVAPELPFFQLIQIINEFETDSVIVCNEDGDYRGIIRNKDILYKISGFQTFLHPGASFSLEILPRNYSLSEITRIVENEDVKIIGLFIRNIPDSNRINLEIKLNSYNVERVTASLKRYGYSITEVGFSTQEAESLKIRYDALIKYLDI